MGALFRIIAASLNALTACIARQFPVRAGEVARTERPGEREFTREAEARADLSERRCVPWSRQTHQFETGALAWQRCTTADGTHDHAGERHCGVQVALRC
jgi:hypothetical protein